MGYNYSFDALVLYKCIEYQICFAACELNKMFGGLDVSNCLLIVDQYKNGINTNIFYDIKKQMLSNIGSPEKSRSSTKVLPDVIIFHGEIIWHRFKNETELKNYINNGNK